MTPAETVTQTVGQRVSQAVWSTPVLDLHTHLYPPEFGSLNLWGIDELLTYHYLVAETLRADPSLTPTSFFARPKADQADLVWQKLFVDRLPLSEATVGVVTVLTDLGLDPQAKDLTQAREFIANTNPKQHLDLILEKSGVKTVTMTNNIFDPSELAVWESDPCYDPRFLPVLRLDPMINSFEEVRYKMPDHRSGDYTAARKYLDHWVGRMKPMYVAASLPSDFKYPSDDQRTQVLRKSILPACQEHKLPMAMMIGVRRQINPLLGDAGDGMGVCDTTAVEALAREYPDVNFIVTTLAKENAHHLAVVARKFANVKVFGCWWFVNNPSIVEEITDMRLEMLGTTFVPQHSDARILDQLLYKWRQNRSVIAKCLTKRFDALVATGYNVSDQQIQSEVDFLLHGNSTTWMNWA